MENEVSQKTNDGTCGVPCTIMHNRRVQCSLTLVLVLLAIFLFAQSLNTFKEYRYIGVGVYPTNTITVSGEGEFFAKPDTAEFTFSITEEAITSAEAQKTATEKANAVLTALKEKGVEEKDIKTIGYDLYPKYEWVADRVCVQYPCDKNQKQVGFTLSQSMSVKVRDLDKAGELLELVTGKGVSNVSGLNFTVADEDQVEAEARKLAIDDAKEKAEKLAADLGVSIVRIVGFSEDGGYGPIMYEERSMAADAAYGMGGAEQKMLSVPVPAGENRTVSNVNITYEVR